MAKKPKTSQTFRTDAGDRRRPVPLKTYKDKPKTDRVGPARPAPRPQAPVRTRVIGSGEIPEGRTRTPPPRPKEPKRKPPNDAEIRKQARDYFSSFSVHPGEKPTARPRGFGSQLGVDYGGEKKKTKGDPLEMLKSPRRRREVAMDDLVKLAPVSLAARREIWRRSSAETRRWAREPTRPVPKAPWEQRMIGEPLSAGFNVLPGGSVRDNLKDLTASFPSAVRAIGSSVGGDIFEVATGQGVPTRTLSLGKDIGIGMAKDVERFIPGIPDRAGAAAYLEAIRSGDWRGVAHVSHEEAIRMQKAWQEEPITGLLTASALVAPPARAANIAKLASSIRAANPGMSALRVLRLARKESYRPGYAARLGIKGGEAPRTLKVKVEGGGEVEVAARPLSRTPLGRAAQRKFDDISRRIAPTRKLSEQRRGVASMHRAQTAEVKRQLLKTQQAAQELTRYVKGPVGRSGGKGAVQARMAAVVTALQGPEADPVATIGAAIGDLRDTLDNGGIEVPTSARIRIEKQLALVERKLERQGLSVVEDERWAPLRRALREHYGADDSDVAMEVVRLQARRWARREPDRDPADWIDSPEGQRAVDNVTEADTVAHVAEPETLPVPEGELPETSAFSPEEAELLDEAGALRTQRAQLRARERTQLHELPNEVALEEARTILDGIDSGDPEDLAAAEKAWKEIARRRAGAGGDTMPSETERLLSQQIKWLEEGIRDAADPESGFHDAISALVTVANMSDRYFREIILDNIPPEAKDAVEVALDRRRNLLVDRWRQRGYLTYGTGDAMGYFPHASIFESLGDRLPGPVRRPAGSNQVLGRVQVPKEAARKGENRLVRWQTGRLNMNPKVLLNTLNARVRVMQTRALREQLVAMGRPVATERDVPKGWWVMNPEGKYIPERVRRAMEMDDNEMDDLVASGEDFDSSIETREGMDSFLDKYRDSFLKEPNDVPAEWYDAGNLVAVPPELVEGLLPKPFQSKPGGASSIIGLTNAAARMATILAYPVGYIASNIPANLAMLTLTNPITLARDIPRALNMLKTNRKLYHRLAAEAGDIQAEAGLPDFYARAQGKLEGTERKVVKGQRFLAERYGEVADTPFRVAAYLGWARKYGAKTEKDLLDLLDNPKHADLRNDLAQRTREDMIDFDTLSQTERETISRYFFLWPLVRGMTKWPVMFAREHPITAAGLAQFGDEEIQQKYGYGELGLAASRAMRHLNIVPIAGGRAIDVNAINPLGGIETPLEALNIGAALGRGDLGAIRDGLAGMTIPQIRELFRDNPDMWALAEATIPGLKYPSSAFEWHGKARGSKIWKREDWWDYMLQRNVRFLPEEIDAAEVKSQAERERREQSGTTEAEESKDKEFEALPIIMQRLGRNDAATLKKVNAGMEAYYHMHSKSRGLSPDEKVDLVNETVRSYYPSRAGDLQEPSASTTDEQKEAYYGWWRDRIYATHNWVLKQGKDLKLLEEK